MHNRNKTGPGDEARLVFSTWQKRGLLPARVERPTLILDSKKVRRNISQMRLLADKAGADFRPHFKTHQSAEIGEWFRAEGVSRITTSSVEMASYFADSGWDDITIAFPTNLAQLEKIRKLSKLVRLGLIFDSLETAQAMDRLQDSTMRAWIKIDAGYGRSGVAWNNTNQLIKLGKVIDLSSRLQFAGLLTHSGQTYRETTRDGVQQIHLQTLDRLRAAKSSLIAANVISTGSVIPISIGDTPTCRLAESLSGVDEIRPGNFVFFDLMQLAIGSCQPADIAIAVACPVVGKHESRKEIVIYGGSVHLSKESIVDDTGKEIYGALAMATGGSFEISAPWMPVRSLSQEHGIISMPDEYMCKVNIGDCLLVVPVHACLTANLYRRYITLEGGHLTRISSIDNT